MLLLFVFVFSVFKSTGINYFLNPSSCTYRTSRDVIVRDVNSSSKLTICRCCQRHRRVENGEFQLCCRIPFHGRQVGQKCFCCSSQKHAYIMLTTLNPNFIYSVALIHRGPLFREIQYIANRPWLPNFPKTKKKKF